jgi:hypothetical protein
MFSGAAFPLAYLKLLRPQKLQSKESGLLFINGKAALWSLVRQSYFVVIYTINLLDHYANFHTQKF